MIFSFIWLSSIFDSHLSCFLIRRKWAIIVGESLVWCYYKGKKKGQLVLIETKR